MNHITDIEVTTALAAIRGGDDEALAAFVERYDTVLAGIAWKAPMDDKDDAKSIATLALIEALRETDAAQFETHPAATLYMIVKNATLDGAREDRTVTIPHMTSFRYAAVMKSHGGDLRSAYATVAAGGAGIAPAAFLAAHAATYAHADRESLSMTPADDDHQAFQLAVEDNVAAIDDHDLVHRHLFPLIDDPNTRDLDIVKLMYGFPQIAGEIVDALADAGFQPGDTLSAEETAEVLKTPGLGARTVFRRRHAALAVMREYLERDTANENN